MRKLSIVLIIIGILVGVSPLVGQLYTEYQENRMMDEWMNSMDVSILEEADTEDPEEGFSQLNEIFAAEGSGNKEAVEVTVAATPKVNETDATVQDEATPKPVNTAPSQTVIGIIQIGKIKLKAPIVEGVSAANLKAGVGHIPGTAALGQPGNCALAGHRNYTFGKFFNRLDEIVVGDEIVISTKKEDLKYKVYKKHVVTPDDVSVLKGKKDDTVITLITCTPIYVATHRLIVHARLEERVLKVP